MEKPQAGLLQVPPGYFERLEANPELLADVPPHMLSTIVHVLQLRDERRTEFKAQLNARFLPL